MLKAILKNPSSVVTHAPTEANRAYLAESFLAEVQARADAIAAQLVQQERGDDEIEARIGEGQRFGRGFADGGLLAWGKVARGREVRLEGAVLLVAQDGAAVRALDNAFFGQQIEVAAQRRDRDVQGVGQLLQRHRAVVVEEVGNALASLNRQQGRGLCFLYFARPVFKCCFFHVRVPSDC